jgi:hypothetical protein
MMATACAPILSADIARHTLFADQSSFTSDLALQRAFLSEPILDAPLSPTLSDCDSISSEALDLRLDSLPPLSRLPTPPSRPFSSIATPKTMNEDRTDSMTDEELDAFLDDMPPLKKNKRFAPQPTHSHFAPPPGQFDITRSNPLSVPQPALAQASPWAPQAEVHLMQPVSLSALLPTPAQRPPWPRPATMPPWPNFNPRPLPLDLGHVATLFAETVSPSWPSDTIYVVLMHTDLPPEVLALALTIMQRTAASKLIRKLHPDLFVVSSLFIADAYVRDHPYRTCQYSEYTEGLFSQSQVDQAVIDILEAMEYRLYRLGTETEIAAALETAHRTNTAHPPVDDAYPSQMDCPKAETLVAENWPVARHKAPGPGLTIDISNTNAHWANGPVTADDTPRDVETCL